MRYGLLFLLFPLALGMISCGRDKESMAGSYKLEKPAQAQSATLQEGRFAINIDGVLGSNGELPFKIKSYVGTNDSEGTIIKEGSLTLKRTRKGEKTLLRLTLAEKLTTEEISISKTVKTPSEITTWLFTQDEISYLAMVKCENEACTNLKFNISASNPKDKESRQAFAIYLKQTLENDAYVLKGYCQMTQTEQIIESVKNPQFIFSLDENSPELKCAASK